jgi:hypothetical protein
MSDGWLVVLAFISSVVASAFIISMGIRAAKRRVTRWDSNSTIWFIMTIGNFGERQVDVWRRRAGYDEETAGTIIRYQILCLIGSFLAFGAIIAALSEYKVLTLAH